MVYKKVVPYVVLALSAVVLYLGVGLIVGFPILGKPKKVLFLTPQVTGKEGHLLPSFDIVLASRELNINTKDIPNGNPIVLFYFSPYCPFCEMEMKEIENNINRLKDINFYIITSYSYGEMDAFWTKSELRNYDNIKMGVDKDSFFTKYFNTTYIPYLAIYGRDRKLKGAFLGWMNSDQMVTVSKM